MQARFVPVSAEHKVAEFTLNSQGCMENLHVTCDNYPCNMDSIRKKNSVATSFLKEMRAVMLFFLLFPVASNWCP